MSKRFGSLICSESGDTTSRVSGHLRVKTANVLRAIPPARAALQPRTKCGTALNLPWVITSNAMHHVPSVNGMKSRKLKCLPSPVWNANAFFGMATL